MNRREDDTTLHPTSICPRPQQTNKQTNREENQGGNELRNNEFVKIKAGKHFSTEKN